MADSAFPAFDNDVVRAMARWPDVPECFGWLQLDRRGAWRIKGERISHRGACSFLGRHYRGDELGRWYVQNGPQRVFVALEYTPWVLHLDGRGGLTTHTELACAPPSAAYVDDEGNLLLMTAWGIGLLDDRDLDRAADWMEFDGDDATRLNWPGCPIAVESVDREQAGARFGYVGRPEP